MKVLQQAQDCLTEYQQQQTPTSEHSDNTRNRSNNMDNWIPPPAGALKLNVDAHLCGDGRWGLGWIVRREDGSWVGAATKVICGIDEVTAAEAMGVLEAINVAELHPHKPIIIETDNAQIVKVIRTKKFPRLLWGQLARKIRAKVDENPFLSVNWVCRKRNKVAHLIANWADVEPNKEWVDSLPPTYYRLPP